MTRADFLKVLGIGAAVWAAVPKVVEEKLDVWGDWAKNIPEADGCLTVEKLKKLQKYIIETPIVEPIRIKYKDYYCMCNGLRI